MSDDEPKIIKVTLEYEDRFQTLEGEAAEKWLEKCNSMAVLAHVHGMNPFEQEPSEWKIKLKE